MAECSMMVALAGNPNSGKTTIFNNITGARQHVGNYPGVTVEKREGIRHYQGKSLLVVDLPGTYSLTAHATDEKVARDMIIQDKPDVIVNVVDAYNLERNLYLAVQLLEMERPVVMALNMVDVAEKMARQVRCRVLEEKLGIAVVPMIGNQNKGTNDLLQAVVERVKTISGNGFRVDYGSDAEDKISGIIACLATLSQNRYPLRWLAVKLLEGDWELRDWVKEQPKGEKVMALVEKAQSDLRRRLGDDLDIVFSECRHKVASEAFQAAVDTTASLPQTASDKIDRVVTHRIWGLPIFLGIMWVLFHLVFTVGKYPQTWIQEGIGTVGQWLGMHMAEGELRDLVVDGIFGGVGTVVSFLPQILLLFLGISLLEDSGYMARAAFVIDRVMKAAGLHGKSFIPLLLGFGCNIPAIMGARTLENYRDRMVTILVAPLMSCSARLPVYTVLTAAFFSEEYAGTILFSVYILGIVMAVAMAYLFRRFIFSGETEPFAMEMPLYHLPTLRTILSHMWERTTLYVKKAGTLILAVAVLVWFLFAYPQQLESSHGLQERERAGEQVFRQGVAERVLHPLQIEMVEENSELWYLIQAISHTEQEGNALGGPNEKQLQAEYGKIYPYAVEYRILEEQYRNEMKEIERLKRTEQLSQSYGGQLGHWVEPAIRPLGFDWKMGVSLIAGFAAKEVFVSTMGTAYSLENGDDGQSLQEALRQDEGITPLTAYSLMVFTLLYTPCLAAVAVVRKETNSWKWAGFTVGYTLILAWVVSFGVRQIGMVMGF